MAIDGKETMKGYWAYTKIDTTPLMFRKTEILGQVSISSFICIPWLYTGKLRVLAFWAGVWTHSEDTNGVWIEEVNDTEVRTIYQYIVDLKEQLESTFQIVKKNLKESTQRYRVNYNKGARKRDMQVGEKV